MSLDVYLELPKPEPGAPAGSGIYVREAGRRREITRAEWDERFPGCEPVTVPQDEPGSCVYSGNITHNMAKMAYEAGIYQLLWRPEDVGLTRGASLVLGLRTGLERLRSDPERFRAFNPSNGWGSYEVLCDFVAEYLAACERWPEAVVLVSR